MAQGSRPGGGKDLRRRSPFIEPRPRILAVCEGSMTEPTYLRDFAEKEQNSLVDVEAVGGKGDPLQVVEAALELRASAEAAAEREGPTARYDAVWAVFDRDDHDRYERACTVAEREGVNTALSNPCFELWFLLHFRHQGGHITCKNVLRTLREELPHYDKNPEFEKIHPGYEEAVQRARRILRNRARAGRPRGNPSTTVHKLTEEVRKIGREFRIQERRRRREEAGL